MVEPHKLNIQFILFTVFQDALPSFIQEWKDNDKCCLNIYYTQPTSTFLTHNFWSNFHVLLQ